MKYPYIAKRFETLAGLTATLAGRESPVILIEGTRQLPESERPRLVALGRLLATELPDAVFRTGNATGSDTAFAEGVGAVDTARLQYVVPYASMGRRRRYADARSVALDTVPVAADGALAAATTSASPGTKRLVDYYSRKNIASAANVKASYLMRDTLKVIGCAASGLDPAAVGIFFVNEAAPLTGGTGHTIRVCVDHGVPVITQKVWREWF